MTATANGVARPLTRDEQRVLTRYANNESAAQITVETGIDRDAVVSIISTLAKDNKNLARNLVAEASQQADRTMTVITGRTAKPATSTAAPAAASSDPIENLLVEAERSGKPGLVRKAARIRAQIAGLTGEMQQTAAERKLRADIEAMTANLAQAKADLRALASGKQPVAMQGGEAGGPAVATKVIRAWAAANGVACQPHGRVPNAVVEAYRAANQ